MRLVDIFFSWISAMALFAVLSLLVGPDSRDTRRACDIHGSWVGLAT